MSSTVGYGVRITDEQLARDGDFEENIRGEFPELVIVRSAPEYNIDDKTTAFVFLKASLTEAGSYKPSVARVTNNQDGLLSLNEFIQKYSSSVENASEAGWYLVDYYSY